VSTRCTQARFSSTASKAGGGYAWPVAAVVGTGGAGLYIFSGKDDKTPSTSRSSDVLSLQDFVVEDQISVESPIKALTLETANAKLRQDVHTFAFEGHGGVKGRVDVARVSSNNPIEDDWDLKVAKGIGGAGTLYSGVYDGHA
jgi:pyruvate dehydrogenase phosphatase